MPLRKSATHETAAKPIVLAHATSPLGHVSSAGDAPIPVELSSGPLLPVCTLVGCGPPQTVRFALGTLAGCALKLPPASKFQPAMSRRKGDADGEGVKVGVCAALGVALFVDEPVGVPVNDAVALCVPLGVRESDAPVLGVPLGVVAALGEGVAERGRPRITTLSIRKVELLVGSCEKRQQKVGESDAFAGSSPVVKPTYQPEFGSDALGAAPA